MIKGKLCLECQRPLKMSANKLSVRVGSFSHNHLYPKSYLSLWVLFSAICYIKQATNGSLT